MAEANISGMSNNFEYTKVEHDLRQKIHDLTIDMKNCRTLEAKNEIQRLITVNISIFNMFLDKRVRDSERANALDLDKLTTEESNFKFS